VRLELNLSNEEKEKILEWKKSLPNNNRVFIYAFIENGKYSDRHYKLHKFVIKSDDAFILEVADNVEML